MHMREKEREGGGGGERERGGGGGERERGGEGEKEREGGGRGRKREMGERKGEYYVCKSIADLFLVCECVPLCTLNLKKSVLQVVHLYLTLAAVSKDPATT